MSDRESHADLPEELGGRLEAYRAGELELEEQRAFERELLSHPELAQLLYTSDSVDAALHEAQAHSKRSNRGKGLRVPLRVTLPLAAAAVLLLMLLPRFTSDPTLEPAPTFRGSETELVAESPRGEVSAETIRFEWSDYGGAEGYRLEVFDANSGLVLESETADTSLEVSAGELSALRGAGGFWRVTALGELESVLATSSPAPLRLR